MADEKIDHPAHYGGKDNPYEAIKIIEAWNLGFHLGNALKYVARAGKKTPDALTDLKKARWYLARAVNSSSVVTHTRGHAVRRGDFTSTALAAAQVWELDAPLLNVVVMIANAASGEFYSDVRTDMRVALENLDKAIAARGGA